MAQDTSMTVEEWLSFRKSVADSLRVDGSRQEENTRLRIAENLMRRGIIDIEELKRQRELTRWDNAPSGERDKNEEEQHD